MAVIKLYDEISKYWGINAKDFTAEVDEIESSGDTEIQLFINSPGGCVFEAMPMYNRLVRFADNGGDVIATIDGLAASCASWIAMAADTVKMYSNTRFTVHNVIGSAYGHKERLKEVAEYMDDVDGQLADIYVARTGKDRDQIVEMMNGKNGTGTTFTADKAKTEGLVDEVLALKAAPKNLSNRHDFEGSLKRQLINDYPKHLVNSDCDCDKCKTRRDALKDGKLIAQSQRRERNLQRIKLLQRK